MASHRRRRAYLRVGVKTLLVTGVAGCMWFKTLPASYADGSATASLCLQFADDGKASFYSRCLEGSATADGGSYHRGQLTAAHRSWPLGSKVLVKHGSKWIVVTITDRGPYTGRNRILDLSEAAFSALDDVDLGVIDVKVYKLPN